MNTFFQWVKSHVRPFIRMPKKEDSALSTDPQSEGNVIEIIEENVKDIEKQAQVGIKIEWKF